jgi:Type III restriction enzyme, res subunit
MSELRDYQADAVEKIENAVRALYVLPTGGGKTVIASRIIEQAVQRGERVLVLTHRREILKQTSLKLPIEHGLIQAGLNLDLEQAVQIASVQTVWERCMRAHKAPLPRADLIIIDEAHHVAARTWRKILEAYPHARRLGLTATPCRSDGRGFGNYFDQLIQGPPGLDAYPLTTAICIRPQSGVKVATRGLLLGDRMNNPAIKLRETQQLEILALRSMELADQVAAGQLKFIDAIDAAYEAALWSGLVKSVGDDVVQATLAAAFANARRP